MARHLEHYPEALDSSPVQEVTFFSSAVTVLKSSLGKFWGLYVLSLLVVILLPTFLFFKEIKLDPALFVTEWLKLIIEGILFFFILEIVRHRSIAFNARRQLMNYLSMNYILPAQEVINSLRRFRDGLGKETSIDLKQSITTARRKWSVLEHALSDDFLSHLPDEGKVTGMLAKSRDEMDIVKCHNILWSLSAVHDVESLDLREFEYLLGQLETFLNSVGRGLVSVNFTGDGHESHQA